MVGLGEMIEEATIVQNTLRSLSMRVDSKISAIEEMKDLDKSTKDDLHDPLTTYEMRIEDKPSKRGRFQGN